MDINIIQKDILKTIEKSVQSGQIANSYIFHGKPGSGKEAVVFEFVKKITLTEKEDFLKNGNIFFLAPGKKEFYQKLFKSKSIDTDESHQWNSFLRNKIYNSFDSQSLDESKNIPIEAIRNLKENIYFKSTKRKIVIIFNAEYLSSGGAESANMLLKIIEEPPANTTFILISNSLNKVKDTIQSRCQKICVPIIDDYVFTDLAQINKNFSTNFLKFITDKNLHELKKFDLYDEEHVLDIIKNFFNAIRYKNAESISNFSNEIIKIYANSKSDFQHNFLIIKKFIKYMIIIKSNTSIDIKFFEFHELAEIISKKYGELDHVMLINEIDSFISSFDRNANSSISVMNMIINSNKALN